MKTLEVVIHNETGLHARPAKVFVNTAKQFQSTIRLRNGEKEVNAKSLISVLTLGVTSGETLQIVVEGEDESEAIVALEEAVRSGLGEEVAHAPAPSPEPPAAQPPTPSPVEPHAETEEGVLRGLPASPGIAIGPLHRWRHTRPPISDAFSDEEEERRLLDEARGAARETLQALHADMSTRAAAEAEIFEVHLELLDDEELLEATYGRIAEGRSAARAWQRAVEARATLVAALDDPLLAARAADLRDVGDRVLRALAGLPQDSTPSLPDYPVIVVARDLTPSDTATLDPDRALALCTAEGGPTAHSAIIARALGIPALVGVGEAVLELEDGTTAILDGGAGTLVVDPDEAALESARAAQAARVEQAKRAKQQAHLHAVTRDGHRVEIVANIGGVDEARRAAAAGAEGVGLLRTEFLFLDRADAPDEAEQFGTYRAILEAFEGQPVIFRTLDIGGDKPLPYIQTPPEQNPFLGERGIRLTLNRPALLRGQLRAILRAAAHGTARIMFPMISDVEEFRRARAIVEELRAELDAPEVELGIMVEVPSTALVADAFAREVDFFSVGTNDLTQYTLAMDRMHPTLASQADALHPAILRLIKRTVEAAEPAGRWVGVCGELGADPQATAILVGLGVAELSVSTPSLADVKERVRGLDMESARAHAARALKCATAVEVRAL